MADRQGSSNSESVYDFKKRSDESGLVCLDPSRTVQSEAEDADINTIVRRFGITGSFPQGLRVPQYADYSEITDYRSALEAIERADQEFMSMPADVRAQFQNDAGLFLEFASNPANIDHLRDLGLAVPRDAASLNQPRVGDPIARPEGGYKDDKASGDPVA